MYLSKVEIVGFKSFSQKTLLNFTDGLTAIVGPNGCGKTNIVDAIRWALGEQKTAVLRSDSFAYVSMTHGFVYDQRYVQLRAEIDPTDYYKITVHIPQLKKEDHKGIMPPGPYMIFIFSKAGGCSESKTIFIEL